MGLKKSILVKISPPFLGVAQFAKLIPVALVPLTVFIVDKLAISSTMSTVHRFDPYRIRTVLYLCTMQFSSKIVEEFLKIYELIYSFLSMLCSTHRFPFCDVFVMREYRGGIHALCHKTGRNAWPNEYYTADQLTHAQYRPFGQLQLRCPGSPEAYLDRTYGASWPHVGATHFFDHRSAGCVISTRFQLEDNMLKPATPY